MGYTECKQPKKKIHFACGLMWSIVYTLISSVNNVLFYKLYFYYFFERPESPTMIA